MSTGPIDFQDLIGGRELFVLVGGSTRGFSSSMTPITYTKERFKYEMIGGCREDLDSNGHLLPHCFNYISPWLKVSGLPFPEEGFICCEANALALAQAATNAYRADKLVVSLFLVNWSMLLKRRLLIEMLLGRRLGIWKKISQIFANTIMSYLISMKYHKAPCDVGSLKKTENQSSSRLTALKKAESKCKELERKIERLEKRITELEQQRSASMNEMVDLWQANEEGRAAIVEFYRPSTKAGYNIA
ncbi:hypothetical protein Dimus_006006 [Dionaea muscipula]